MQSRAARRPHRRRRPRLREPLRSRLVEERGAIALRALYGMLDLLRRYEAAAVDRACAFAASSGIASFKFLRTYLSHHATPLKLKNEHRIIPEIETYTDHFTTLTQGAPS